MQAVPRHILGNLVTAAIASAVVSAVLVVVSDGADVGRALMRSRHARRC